MYRAPAPLPHPLAPRQYRAPGARGDAAWREVERRAVLEPAWHLVADDGQLANDGDFVTATLLGRPLQIRRFAGGGVDGGVVALSNVCGHRHCRLTGEAAGNSPTMRCGYHGWEYGRDGRTRRIPRPRDFAPFPGDRPRLPRYACERVGGLWFVRIAEDGPTLREHLGDLHGRLAERFAAPFTPTLRRTLDYAADWKVPVENTLEAYHVDAVHPHSFGSAPPEERCEHGFGPNRNLVRHRPAVRQRPAQHRAVPPDGELRAAATGGSPRRCGTSSTTCSPTCCSASPTPSRWCSASSPRPTVRPAGTPASASCGSSGGCRRT